MQVKGVPVLFWTTIHLIILTKKKKKLYIYIRLHKGLNKVKGTKWWQNIIIQNLKGWLEHKKTKICHNLLALMLFQSFMRFFLQLNTK